MRTMNVLALLSIGLIALACASEAGHHCSGTAAQCGEASADAKASDGTDGTAASDGTDLTDGSEATDGTGIKDPDTPPGCAFDKENVGKIVGKHIDNFGALDVNQEAYYLHDNCGDDKKVVWVILSTGW